MMVFGNHNTTISFLLKRGRMLFSLFLIGKESGYAINFEFYNELLTNNFEVFYETY